MSRLLPGLIALMLLVGLIGGTLLALLHAAPDFDPLALLDDAYLRRVVRFTVWQATLSTLLSVGLGVLVARALARRGAFPGRIWLLRLFGLPLVVPSIVAVFGLIAVYGGSGWLNVLATRLGLPGWGFPYGLTGILLAHVFFNLPLTVRLLLPLWQTVPGETWRLAAQLGFGSGAVWRHIEWPLLRQSLPGVAGLVFMLCFTSFAVVLTLGGGPRATTIEVALYQALRFDFDIGRAALLALLQLSFCGILVTLLQRFTQPMAMDPTPGRRSDRPDRAPLTARCLDTMLIGCATVLVLLPLAAILIAGLGGPLGAVLNDPRFWRSAANSLLVSLGASTLCLLLGWPLIGAAVTLRQRLDRPRWADAVELGGMLVLVAPPLVLGTGLFIILMPRVDVFALALLLVLLINALMGLPYLIRILGPQRLQVAAQYDHLCASLGITGWRRLRLVEWPLLRRPLGLGLGLCAALAVGDLGVIALFGTRDTTTLPLLLYQQLGSYQMSRAAVTALALVLLSLLLFVLAERLIGGRRHA